MSGKVFTIFWRYWDYVSIRATEYTALEVLGMTNVLFMHLRSEWEKFNWDIEELKYKMQKLKLLDRRWQIL